MWDNKNKKRVWRPERHDVTSRGGGMYLQRQGALEEAQGVGALLPGVAAGVSVDVQGPQIHRLDLGSGGKQGREW